jgi:alkanesulfonate monooxygenase SsuD/methylene tetrahydromethanopterin reductase-like flavin-dependent oxidoreductase (luciferase family)
VRLLSVLDQSPISEGSTGGDALGNSIDLAQLAESLGYHRYWIAEHRAWPVRELLDQLSNAASARGGTACKT